MIAAELTPVDWLALVQHELLLFASLFFVLGMIDELAILPEDGRTGRT